MINLVGDEYSNSCCNKEPDPEAQTKDQLFDTLSTAVGMAFPDGFVLLVKGDSLGDVHLADNMGDKGTLGLLKDALVLLDEFGEKI
jgi:hypothetical protein